MCGIKPTSKKICVSVCIQLYGKYIIYQFTIIKNICSFVNIFLQISCRFTRNSSCPGISPQRCLARIIAKSYHFQTVIKFSRCIKSKKVLTSDEQRKGLLSSVPHKRKQKNTAEISTDCLCSYLHTVLG